MEVNYKDRKFFCGSVSDENCSYDITTIFEIIDVELPYLYCWYVFGDIETEEAFKDMLDKCSGIIRKAENDFAKSFNIEEYFCSEKRKEEIIQKVKKLGH